MFNSAVGRQIHSSHRFNVLSAHRQYQQGNI
jgi:hypothetical protein